MLSKWVEVFEEGIRKVTRQKRLGPIILVTRKYKQRKERKAFYQDYLVKALHFSNILQVPVRNGRPAHCRLNGWSQATNMQITKQQRICKFEKRPASWAFTVPLCLKGHVYCPTFPHVRCASKTKQMVLHGNLIFHRKQNGRRQFLCWQDI